MSKVICDICFHHCALEEGQSGFCRGRKNKGGKIVDANYGFLTSLALDPIEKKPFAFFHPGALILSAGSYGCNLRCPFCQNHEISQHDLKAKAIYMAPRQLVEQALALKEQGNIGLAFTYNEPMIGYEYIRDTARLAKESGLINVVVTNGSVSQKALEEVLPYIDAFNVDLKAFQPSSYQKMSGDLQTVKDFIELASSKAHVEVTTLIVPKMNDSEQEIEQLASFIASISDEIPLHLTRYFPGWKEKEAPTPIDDLLKLQQVAQKHLKHVKLGNV